MVDEGHLSQLIDAVKAIDHQTYLGSPIPSEPDDLITSFTSEFIRLDPQQRQTLIKSFNIKDSDTFLSYARRMAVLAVREGSIERVWYGLIASVIADENGDSRDTLVVLTLLNHSAKKLRMNPRRLLRQAKELAGPRATKTINGFIYWPRSLGVMGQKEVMTEQGFDYEWIKPGEDWLDHILDFIDRIWPPKRRP